MDNQPNRSSSHAVYSIKLHIVFVTKYRRKTLTPELLDYLRDAFGLVLSDWRCTLLEFGGEADHVHLLVEIHPALNLSTLINNLKTASSRRIRNRFAEHLKPFYQKPYFWHRAYYVGSVGGATLETVHAMWKLREQLKKQEEEKQNRPLDPLLPFGLRRGMLGQMFNEQRKNLHFTNIFVIFLLPKVDIP